MKRWLPSLSVLLAGCLTAPSCFSMPEFALPEGFVVEELVAGVPNARALALGDDGTLFVSTRRAGEVYAVRDALSGNPTVLTIAEDLKMPNGIAFRDGDLYVATVSQLLRYAAIEERLDAPGDPEVVDAALPVEGKLHAWKYIAFGPDGKLYVSLGAPCNVCDKPELATMLRMNADGSEREVYAYGIRNSVGFDWHPDTGELWFSDNGRDMMGDDIPPCELNRITAPGQHFGFPFCHGSNIRDPQFGDLGRCEESIAPVQALAPHAAPLGIAFYTGDLFPDDYAGNVFIAEHGSWNRSKSAGKTGHRVTLVRLEGGTAISYEPFMEGFLTASDETLGRPVDVLVAPDGALLVSDDLRGVIYRISYRPGSE
ncbi:MAG: PQQ-dependent sugar dehydrogenase [Gammaproteobacteria bacterium]